MSDLGQTFNGCTFLQKSKAIFGWNAKRECNMLWVQYDTNDMFLSLFLFLTIWDHLKMRYCHWIEKAVKDAFPEICLTMIYMASHSDIYGLLHPLMKPSFIHFNCNILSHYGLVKWKSSSTVLCYAFYHNVYFLVLDEGFKNCKCFQAVCQLNFFCINAFVIY